MAGNGQSPVTVPTMMQSTTEGSTPALRQACATRLGRQIAGRLRGIQDVTLADARALDDPGVGGVDHARQILVGQDLGGNRATGPDDATADHEMASAPGAGAPRFREEGVTCDRRRQLLAETYLREAIGDIDGVLHGGCVRASVTDQRDAVDAQQRRASVLGVVGALAEAFEGAGHQRGAELGQQARARDLLLDDSQHRLRGALDALEQDVAGEPIGHDHVDLPLEDVAPLDVADVAEVGVVRRNAGQNLVGFPGQRRPLVLFGAVRQQADLRSRLAVQQPGVDRAQHAELRQHRRLGVDVGPHVEQRALAGPGGEGGDDGRPFDTGQPAQHEQAAGHHRARVAGGDDRVSLAGLHQIEADPHRRLLLLLHRHRRGVVHGDHVGRVAHGDARPLGAERLQLGPQARLVSHEDDIDSARAHGGHDALDLDTRRGVGAHGVDGNTRHVRGPSSGP